MTDIYVINETAKRKIKELKSFRDSTFRNKVDFLNYSWYDLPEIIFSELDCDTRLGYFNSEQNLIVMSDVFLDDSLEEEMKAVFLHELAHWVVYRKYGNYAMTHGTAFRKVCETIGVTDGFEKAVVSIKDWQERKQKAEKKVRKLLALSESPFEAEADSAMAKAQTLMSQYSLDYLSNKGDDRLFGIDLDTLGRIDSWRNSLARLVADLSGCYRIIVGTGRGRHISYFGSKEQVESALYFQLYFEDALEEEYRKNKGSLYGIGGKNTFLNGLCRSLYRKAFTTGLNTSIVLSQTKSEERYWELAEGRKVNIRSHARAGAGYRLGAEVGEGMSIPSKQSACKVKRIGYNG